MSLLLTDKLIQQIELWQASPEKVMQENPQFMRWLLHDIALFKQLMELTSSDFQTLQNQINNISLTPGPQGDPGTPGTPGSPSIVPGPPGGPGDPGSPGPGVATGGLPGQVLTKVSASLYDTDWEDLPPSSGGNSFLFGFEGEQGEDGSFGPPGPQGPQGPIGATGATGAGGTGTIGAQGYPGMDGEDGQDGFSIPGRPGDSGAAGAAGAIGAQGVPGPFIIGGDGEQGEDGFGVPGVAGTTGATGATGATGPVGSATLLYSNTTIPAGNTVASTAAETAFTSFYTLPANTVAAGDVIRVTLSGVYSTALTPPTIEGKIKFGSTVMLDSGAVTAVGSVTNGKWNAEAWFVVQSIGAGGAVEAHGRLEFATTLGAALTVPIGNIAAIAIDTTASQAITATAQWGTSSASNTIQLREMVIERLTPTAVSTAQAGLNLVGQLTASNSASLDFATVITSTYDDYLIEFISVIPVTNATRLWMRMSTNGGASYDSGANYGYLSVGTNRFTAGNQAADTGGTKIILQSSTMDNTSTKGFSGYMRLKNPLSTTVHKNTHHEAHITSGGGTLEVITGSGWYLSTTAVNAFQFLFDSGNISSGTIRVYGFAK